MQRRVPDVTKLERLLGDRPNTDLAQILAAVIDVRPRAAAGTRRGRTGSGSQAALCAS